MAFDVNETQPRGRGVPSDRGRMAERASAPGEDQIPDDDFKALLDAYEGKTQTFSEGEVIKGRVIAVSGSGVVVDVGFKSEGIIPTEQFLDESGKCSVKVGDKVDVFLEQTEDSEGYVVLSREKAERMKIWDEIERAYRDGSIIKGRVIERIKGASCRPRATHRSRQSGCGRWGERTPP